MVKHIGLHEPNDLLRDFARLLANETLLDIHYHETITQDEAPTLLET